MTGSPQRGSALSPSEVVKSDAPVSLNQPAEAGEQMHDHSQAVMKASLASSMKAVQLNAEKQMKALVQEEEAQ